MNFIKDTDVTIINNSTQQPIDGNNYTVVEVTSDGRCFFGSVALAYKINNGELCTSTLIDNVLSTLNDWIKKNLTEVVQKTPSECATIQAIASYARSSAYAEIPDKKYEGELDIVTKENTKNVDAINEINFIFPERLTNCPYREDVRNDIQALLETQTFKKNQAEFVTFCNAFIENQNGTYTFAEPEIITQILCNTLQQNICVVSNSYTTVITYYSNYDDLNSLPTIYVKKLQYAHYQALIPATKIPVAQSSPVSLRIKYNRCEIKDLPSTGWRGSYGSSKTNRIAAKDSSDTENVVSKVNKTIHEKSDFNNFSVIREKDVQVMDDKNNQINSDNLTNANEDWYFLVNLKDKAKSRKGGRYKKSRRLTRHKKHNQHKKSQKRRRKSEKKP
jgi:hypothetical protein